jgi:hypothetical protein
MNHISGVKSLKSLSIGLTTGVCICVEQYNKTTKRQE